jgi:abhydrolase domain-containing protein 17
LASDLLDYVRSLLKVHVLAVEYPGYGVYDGSPNADQIIDDAMDVYDYLT